MILKRKIGLVCLMIGLEFGMFFQVQAQNKSADVASVHFVGHVVKSGETIYSISKKYQISQSELIQANPALRLGLKSGEMVKIPVRPALDSTEPKELRFHSYKVKRKNTLRSIARLYQVTVNDILTYNPEARNGIRKRQRLRIPYSEDLQKMNAQQRIMTVVKDTTAFRTVTHKVEPQETLYSLARQYHTSVAALLKENPEAREGLKTGMVLRISAPLLHHSVGQGQPAGPYFIYLVVSGDTFWHLDQKYYTSQSELVALNPALQDGLKAGLRIRIPVRDQPKIKVVPDDGNSFIHYQVKKGETIFELSRKFNVRMTELRRINPLLAYSGLLEGETILIPRVQPQKAQQDILSSVNGNEVSSDSLAGGGNDFAVQMSVDQSDSLCIPDPNAALQTYHIALFLPLYLLANDTVNRIPVTPEEMMQDTVLMKRTGGDTDSLPTDSFRIRQPKIVYPPSAHFLEFYEGVLIALDSLEHRGMKVELSVYDSNPDQPGLDSLLNLDEMKNMDLIIGPVFPAFQSAVSDFSRLHSIPMISPLSSAGDLEKTNPYYFKVNPDKNYLVRKTADYISDQYYDKNMVVLQMGEYKHLPEARLVDLCREKFFSSDYARNSKEVLFHEYNFPKEDYNGLSRIMSSKKENVFIIPSETEGQVSVAVTNLNALAEDYPVTLVGMSNFLRYKSIQIEYFHHTNLHLLTPYYVDYQSSLVNNFIRKYRTNFSAEPSQFSFQGYDVAYYFMNALFRYGKSFMSCLAGNKVELTQGAFYFEKVNANGGYMNHGLFITHYTPDYDIKMDGIVGQPLDYQLEQTK